jgi:hypothetical protein
MKVKTKKGVGDLMAKVLKDNPGVSPEEKEPELKGTFASVMLVGAFIVITWIGAFSLFLSRM